MEYDVFIVRINPATPIYAHEIELEHYVELLTNYDAFYKEYNRVNENTGSPKISRTRLDIKSKEKSQDI